MNPTAYSDDEPRLLVVAESLLSRAGLTALLEERGCIVLLANDGTGLQQAIDRHAPDALVVDFGWGGEAMSRRLLELTPDLPVLALAALEDSEFLSRLLQTALLFPQFALLQRDSDPDAIVAALDTLASGLSALDPRVTSLLSLLRSQPAGALAQPPDRARIRSAAAIWRAG